MTVGASIGRFTPPISLESIYVIYELCKEIFDLLDTKTPEHARRIEIHAATSGRTTAGAVEASNVVNVETLGMLTNWVMPKSAVSFQRRLVRYETFFHEDLRKAKELIHPTANVEPVTSEPSR